MKHIGWLVNGTFYSLIDAVRVEKIRVNCGRNVQILEIYAEGEVCVRY